MKILCFFPYPVLASISKSAFNTSLAWTFVAYLKVKSAVVEVFRRRRAGYDSVSNTLPHCST